MPLPTANNSNLVLASSLAAATAALLYTVKVLLWNDRPLPSAHVLSLTHFKQSPRRFLITGAAGGLGSHLVSRFLSQGHLVMATDLNLEPLLKLQATYPKTLLVAKVDVSNNSDWESCISTIDKAWGGLDVCLNVAGYLNPTAAQNCTAKDVHLHVDVNVKGVMFGTAHASRLMLKRRCPQGSHIVNVASLGAIAPVSGVSLYIGTKYAVRGFSLCAAKDLFPQGVYVSVVLPDAIATPMLDLQLHHRESAMAYSGGYLTVDQVGEAIERMLYTRQREMKVATSFMRGLMARVDDIFSGSLIIGWSEDLMRKRGEAKQAQIKTQAQP